MPNADLEALANDFRQVKVHKWGAVAGSDPDRVATEKRNYRSLLGAMRKTQCQPAHLLDHPFFEDLRELPPYPFHSARLASSDGVLPELWTHSLATEPPSPPAPTATVPRIRVVCNDTDFPEALRRLDQRLRHEGARVEYTPLTAVQASLRTPTSSSRKPPAAAARPPQITTPMAGPTHSGRASAPAVPASPIGKLQETLGRCALWSDGPTTTEQRSTQPPPMSGGGATNGPAVRDLRSTAHTPTHARSQQQQTAATPATASTPTPVNTPPRAPTAAERRRSVRLQRRATAQRVVY
jgi:hypothetical protein